MAGRPKGTAKSGGRKKGTPNKLTRDLKEMILGALNDAGGQKYLAIQAKKNPAAFMQLLGKILPYQVTGEGSEPIPYKISPALQEAIDRVYSNARTARGENQ